MQLSYKALYNSWLCGCAPQPLASLLASGCKGAYRALCQTLVSLASQVTPGMYLVTSSIPQLEPTQVSEDSRNTWGGDGRGLYWFGREAQTPKMATGSSLVSEGQWLGRWAEVWGLLVWRLIRGDWWLDWRIRAHAGKTRAMCTHHSRSSSNPLHGVHEVQLL